MFSKIDRVYNQNENITFIIDGGKIVVFLTWKY